MIGAKRPTTAAVPSWRQRLRWMIHRQPLLPLALASATGILIDSMLVDVGANLGSPQRAGLWISLSLVLSARVVLGSTREKSCCVILVWLPLAGATHCLRDAAYRKAPLVGMVGPEKRAAILEGVIDRPVASRQKSISERQAHRQESPWHSWFELDVTGVRLGHEMQPCGGRVLVLVDGDCRQRRPGDHVRVYGRLSAIVGPTNPGEPDRRDVFRQRHLHAQIECIATDQIVDLRRRPSPAHRLLRGIASIAARGRASLVRHMSESSGALAVALVLGQREAVDESTRDLLLVTGTAHLLSVSGLHLAIVVAIGGWIATLARFPLPAKIVWILLICFLYTAITGARPPVVRAAILVGTLMVALWIRRTGQPVNTLSLAAMILMAVNPLLLFNMGVQLSFLAVATLLTCSLRESHPSDSIRDATVREEQLRLLVDQSRSRTTRVMILCGRRLGQALWFSGCVTVISAPLVWLHFHVVTPISVLTNVILGPLLFVAVASGVSTFVAGLIWEPGVIVPAWICDLTMGLMRGVIELAASVPGGHHWLPAPPGWWVAIFYIGIAGSMLTSRKRLGSTARYAWIAIWMGSAWWIATTGASLPSDTLEAIFVDVGHGTSVVLRTSRDEVWLYDCGRLGNESFSSRGIDSTLWSLGATRLGGIVLSHADADHFNALPGLLRRFQVDAIYTPPGMMQRPKPALVAVGEEVSRRKVKVIELAQGWVINSAGMTLEVLHPPAGGVAGNDNANSLVARIQIPGVHAADPGRFLLLPGDLEAPGTECLIRSERPPPGSVLMAPHHGSLSQDTAAVVQWARPALTVVSGGQRAERPEVHELLSQTGCPVHVTSQSGAIRVRINPAGAIEVRHWRDSPW